MHSLFAGYKNVTRELRDIARHMFFRVERVERVERAESEYPLPKLLCLPCLL